MSKLKLDIKNKNIGIIIYTIKTKNKKNSWLYVIDTTKENVIELYYKNGLLANKNIYSFDNKTIRNTLEDLSKEDNTKDYYSKKYNTVVLLDK